MYSIKYIWDKEDFEQLKSLKGKKIIAWGCGKIFEKVYKNYLENSEIEIVYYIDNDARMWNSTIAGGEGRICAS